MINYRCKRSASENTFIIAGEEMFCKQTRGARKESIDGGHDVRGVNGSRVVYLAVGVRPVQKNSINLYRAVSAFLLAPPLSHVVKSIVIES